MKHITVMLKEAVEYMAPVSGGVYLDATLGGGGHAEAILEASSPAGRLIGLDQDDTAIEEAGRRLQRFGDRVIIVRENFRHMAGVLRQLQIEKIDGILMDLGLSSFQLESEERGFSFRSPAQLDMRMDRRGQLTAADIVATASKEDLVRILRLYGEEQEAGRIAGAIIRARQEGPIGSAVDLAEIISRAVSPPRRRGRIHPATKSFQALRIAVNVELESLTEALDSGIDLLRTGGRMVAISFHSLEDRIVKQRYREWAVGCICSPRIPVCICGHQPQARLLNRKPVLPSSEEVSANPRSRSAKLRAIERL
ncbi:MAG: 16S rRNA (cytosine(1402)-N(4))-methyltransferase RsmH [bacterium]|nr:16S rRNA (cytosine(1402)-N(4))-methyltransferase RsmH [bacterium]